MLKEKLEETKKEVLEEKEKLEEKLRVFNGGLTSYFLLDVYPAGGPIHHERLTLEKLDEVELTGKDVMIDIGLETGGLCIPYGFFGEKFIQYGQKALQKLIDSLEGAHPEDITKLEGMRV